MVWPQNAWTRFWVRNTSPTCKEVTIFTTSSMMAQNGDDKDELIRCQDVCYTWLWKHRIHQIYVPWSCVYSILVIFLFKFQHLLTNKNFQEWRPGAGKIQRYIHCVSKTNPNIFGRFKMLSLKTAFSGKIENSTKFSKAWIKPPILPITVLPTPKETDSSNFQLMLLCFTGPCLNIWCQPTYKQIHPNWLNQTHLHTTTSM